MDDALSRLLADIRPRGSVFDQSVLGPPWSLRVEEGEALTLVALLDSEGYIGPDDGEPQPIRRGDIALVVGPEPYMVSDEPGATPRVVVRSGNVCTTPTGDELVDAGEVAGVCHLDPSTDGASVLLKGTYGVHQSVCEQLLRGLPRVVVVPAGPAPNPLLAMITTELTGVRAGQQVVLDRLLDLLLVSTLRDWLDRPGSGAPAWYRAQEDHVVGTALHLMHDQPARPWTVAGLAAETGVSRPVFARRFTQLVGEPPMAYLACWRMCLAADLLRETDATVAWIARRVGYSDAFALSVAFKRIYGVRPTEHRTVA